MKNLFLIVLFYLTLSNGMGMRAYASDATGVEIAFLEDSCTTYTEGKKIKKKYEPRVRMAFRKSQNGWEAHDNSASDMDELKQASKRFSGERKWFVVDQERLLGLLNSQGVEEYHWYKDVGIQNIIGTQPPATLTQRDKMFAGWSGCDVRKPYVLVSHQPKKGTDGWARIRASYKPNTQILHLIGTYSTELYSCSDERDQEGKIIKAKISVDMLQTVNELVSSV